MPSSLRRTSVHNPSIAEMTGMRMVSGDDVDDPVIIVGDVDDADADGQEKVVGVVVWALLPAPQHAAAMVAASRAGDGDFICVLV